jgi:hypothetical protein
MLTDALAASFELKGLLSPEVAVKPFAVWPEAAMGGRFLL